MLLNGFACCCCCCCWSPRTDVGDGDGEDEEDAAAAAAAAFSGLKQERNEGGTPFRAAAAAAAVNESQLFAFFKSLNKQFYLNNF